MGWLKLFRKHKHSFFFVRRSVWSTSYRFECETCGYQHEISIFDFWGDTQPNLAAVWLWNNA